MFTPSELAEMRRAVEAHLPEQATVKRLTVEDDGGGGKDETWQDQATVAADVAKTNTPSESEAGEKVVVNRATYQVTLPAGTDVLPGDRIAISGLLLHVLTVYPRGTVELARMAACVEVVE